MHTFLVHEPPRRFRFGITPRAALQAPPHPVNWSASLSHFRWPKPLPPLLLVVCGICLLSLYLKQFRLRSKESAKGYIDRTKPYHPSEGVSRGKQRRAGTEYIHVRYIHHLPRTYIHLTHTHTANTFLSFALSAEFPGVIVSLVHHSAPAYIDVGCTLRREPFSDS